MTTVESGTAVGVEYIPEETRAVAIHEAGHAAAAHVFLKGSESTRISIRMRAGSLGHHQALEKEERFSSWKHEEMAKLAWTLGAMAAEHVFYGENATGVGGDLQAATGRAAWMVGVSGMGPERDRARTASRAERGARARSASGMAKRFEAIGLQLMNRAQRRLPARLDRGRARRPDQEAARRADHRPGVRQRLPARPPEQGRGREDRGPRSSTAGSSTATSSSSCSTRSGCKEPAIDLEKEETWPTL